jgi:galactokinase/mevalonate kinase-like predicted kinase
MLICPATPLRLGLAGGGTDVSPYSDIYYLWGSSFDIILNLYQEVLKC